MAEGKLVRPDANEDGPILLKVQHTKVWLQLASNSDLSKTWKYDHSLIRWHHLLPQGPATRNPWLSAHPNQEAILLEEDEFPNPAAQGRPRRQVSSRIFLPIRRDAARKWTGLQDARGRPCEILNELPAVPHPSRQQWRKHGGLVGLIIQTTQRMLLIALNQLLSTLSSPSQSPSLNLSWFFPLDHTNNIMLLLSTKSISSHAGKSTTEHSRSVLQVPRVCETVLRLVERLLDLLVLLELRVGFLEVALL